MHSGNHHRPFFYLVTANLLILLLLFGWTSGIPLKGAAAGILLGNGFNYQGVLNIDGVPANGKFDLRVTLYDNATDGNMIGSAVLKQEVPITEGWFSVVLDFGPAAFGPEARWIQIEVKEPNKSSYTLLSPRQQISPVPSALWAQAPWRTSGIHLYYTSGHVGIGETAPRWPLHVKAGQAVGLFESTTNDFGSVLELRNRSLAISRKFLGAINFNDVESTYPGQIAYTSTDEMTFRVDHAEQLRISDEGLTIPATTRFLAIPAAAFIPEHTEESGLSHAVSERGLRHYCSNQFCYGDTYIAPVNLPHGATITQLVLVGEDKDSNYDMYIELYRADWVDLQTADLMATVTSNGSVPNLRYFFTEDISHAKVDNQFHSYSISAYLHRDDTAIRSVHITYKVTEPVP